MSAPGAEDGEGVADFANKLLVGLHETLALYQLASRLGVKREGPAGWGLELARALARQYVAGFERPKQRGKAGRPRQKTLAYEEALATAIALQEWKSGRRRGAAARVASFVAEAIEAGDGRRRPSRRGVANRAAQIQQDAARLSPIMRFLAAEKVRLAMAGFTIDEIVQKFRELEARPGETPEEAIARISQTEIGLLLAAEFYKNPPRR